MDPIREIQKVRLELKQDHSSFSEKMRSELIQFNKNTQIILNTIDDKINSRVAEEITVAFTEVKNLIKNLTMRLP